MNAVWPFRDGPFPSLGDSEVHVWKCRLTADAAELAARLATLSHDEQNRARQFKMDRPRDQFVIARSTLRALLGRYLAVTPETIAFELNEHGKPRLKIPSATLEFNVSHSHDLALFAFSRSTPVGVDVEWLGRQLAHADIAKRFFSEREQAQLNEIPAADRHRAFLE
ncbi:MAG TPA: 4'-phosphopantetheinyl transferase superfamily protein, partial [Roseimicrobium sp.]|nr:4'-phosphopantetheinyl transferase superfamily protein [Roseimicrobium sp.]